MLVAIDGFGKSSYLSLKRINRINAWGAMQLYFHPIFVLIPILAIAAMQGISFAIVGAGHRKAWVLVLPIMIAVWYAVEQVIALFVHSSLFPLFWGLALPIIVLVAAWTFRRFRERHGS